MIKFRSLGDMRWIAEMTMISFSHCKCYRHLLIEISSLANEEDGHKYKQMRIAFAYG